MATAALPPRLNAMSADEETLYFLPSNRKALTPKLTHQFELTWPWPTGTAQDPGSSEACHSDVAGQDEARRYGRATHIVSLTADPRRPPAYGTRRVCLVLTPGYRFRLPLLRADPASVESSRLAGQQQQHPIYWQVAHRPALGAPSVAPPVCADLVVGEARAVEVAARRRREQHTRRARQGAMPPVLARVTLGEDAGQSTATSETTPAGPEAAAATAKTPVYTHCLRSIPYRVAFSQTWADTLFVSLPCEERVVTLRAPSRLAKAAASIAARAFVHDMACVGSLSLPRGVVPLELAEVPERSVVAVGTYEHGVLLCAVADATAAVESVVRTVALAGQGSPLFPVCTIAPVFPARAPTGSRTSEATPFFSWAQKASTLAASRDGALVVSSPYEPCPTVVKLSDHRSGHGRQENVPVGPLFEQLQHCSLYPTAQIDHTDRLVVADANRLVSLAAFMDSNDRDLTGVAGHTPPSVRHRVVYRHSGFLLRIADSPAVCYEVKYKLSPNRVQVYTTSYTRHFVIAVDGTNDVLLLDRKLLSYSLLSSFRLSAAAQDGPHATPATLATPATPATSTRTTQDGPPRKRPRTGAKNDAEPTTTSLPYGLCEPDDLTNLCAGLAVVAAGSGWLCVAAAHDQRWLSLVTWSGK